MLRIVHKRRYVVYAAALAIAVVAGGLTAWLLTRPAPPGWLPAFAQRVAAEHGDSHPDAAYYGHDHWFHESGMIAQPEDYVSEYRVVMVGRFSRTHTSVGDSRESGNVLIVGVNSADGNYVTWVMSRHPARLNDLQTTVFETYRPLHELELPQQ
jgi:hypothetical protein